MAQEGTAYESPQVETFQYTPPHRNGRESGASEHLPQEYTGPREEAVLRWMERQQREIEEATRKSRYASYLGYSVEGVGYSGFAGPNDDNVFTHQIAEGLGYDIFDDIHSIAATGSKILSNKYFRKFRHFAEKETIQALDIFNNTGWVIQFTAQWVRGFGNWDAVNFKDTIAENFTSGMMYSLGDDHIKEFEKTWKRWEKAAKNGSLEGKEKEIYERFRNDGIGENAKFEGKNAERKFVIFMENQLKDSFSKLGEKWGEEYTTMMGLPQHSQDRFLMQRAVTAGNTVGERLKLQLNKGWADFERGNALDIALEEKTEEHNDTIKKVSRAEIGFKNEMTLKDDFGQKSKKKIKLTHVDDITEVTNSIVRNAKVRLAYDSEKGKLALVDLIAEHIAAIGVENIPGEVKKLLPGEIKIEHDKKTNSDKVSIRTNQRFFGKDNNDPRPVMLPSFLFYAKNQTTGKKYTEEELKEIDLALVGKGIELGVIKEDPEKVAARATEKELNERRKEVKQLYQDAGITPEEFLMIIGLNPVKKKNASGRTIIGAEIEEEEDQNGLKTKKKNFYEPEKLVDRISDAQKLAGIAAWLKTRKQKASVTAQEEDKYRGIVFAVMEGLDLEHPGEENLLEKKGILEKGHKLGQKDIKQKFIFDLDTVKSIADDNEKLEKLDKLLLINETNRWMKFIPGEKHKALLQSVTDNLRLTDTTIPDIVIENKKVMVKIGNGAVKLRNADEVLNLEKLEFLRDKARDTTISRNRVEYEHEEVIKIIAWLNNIGVATPEVATEEILEKIAAFKDNQLSGKQADKLVSDLNKIGNQQVDIQVKEIVSQIGQKASRGAEGQEVNEKQNVVEEINTMISNVSASMDKLQEQEKNLYLGMNLKAGQDDALSLMKKIQEMLQKKTGSKPEFEFGEAGLVIIAGAEKRKIEQIFAIEILKEIRETISDSVEMNRYRIREVLGETVSPEKKEENKDNYVIPEKLLPEEIRKGDNINELKISELEPEKAKTVLSKLLNFREIINKSKEFFVGGDKNNVTGPTGKPPPTPGNGTNHVNHLNI